MRQRHLHGALIGLALSIFALIPPATAAEPASWSSCERDADCLVVRSICPNFYWAVHWQFSFANAARNADAGDGDGMCAPSFQARPSAAQCVQGQCTLPPNQAGLPAAQN